MGRTRNKNMIMRRYDTLLKMALFTNEEGFLVMFYTLLELLGRSF